MIDVSFEDQDLTVSPLRAQQILSRLLERGAKFFRCDSEDIALISAGEVVTLSGDAQHMGALWLFCQAALAGLLLNDWREPDTSLKAHLRQARQQEELAQELY